MTFKPADIPASCYQNPRYAALNYRAPVLVSGKKPVEIPKDRYRSDLERRFAKHLELRRASKEIEWWSYGSMKLRLAEGAWFCPDFAVKEFAGLFFYETKGWFREAAKVRTKVAAEQFPFPIWIVTAAGDGFEYRRL